MYRVLNPHETHRMVEGIPVWKTQNILADGYICTILLPQKAAFIYVMRTDCNVKTFNIKDI
jgi:hypothetical protein